MSIRVGGVSAPPYLSKHSGPVIVAGSAMCLHDDLEEARKQYGEVSVIAVNGAAREVKAFALYSRHPERFTELRWSHHQLRKFGLGFSTHSNKSGAQYLWDIQGGGGSAWDARKVASFMGFDLVILCGCPMEVGPYVGGHNLGGFMHREDIVSGFRNNIEKETDWHEGCISMSGWTRELLGC